MMRERGVRATAGAIARRLLALVYRRERLIVQIKDLDSIVQPRAGTSLRIEDLGREQLLALAELNRKRDAADADPRFRAYLDAGFHGFVAIRDDEVVGYYWWVDREGQDRFPDLRDLGLGIELGEKDVYGSDFFLLEEHRGAGAAGQFLCGAETALRDRGFERIWGYVLADNRAARWTFEVRGYRSAWIVERTHLPGWTRTRRIAVDAQGDLPG
jgi:GNAT superfamily N-acetyltransferase